MRKVTIEDISRETGLSRGTVSRALNDRSEISLETRQRVLNACKKLKYVPSHAARSLATGRNYTLALFVDDLQSPLSAAMIRGALGLTAPQGYFVHLVELNARVPAADRIRQLAAERIDGALLFSALDAEAAAILRAGLERRPLAGCAAIANLDADVFEPDLAEAGRMAARYLFEHRAQSALYVHRDARGWNERFRGFREAWLAAGRSEAAIRTVQLAPRVAVAPSASKVEALVLDQSELLSAALRSVSSAAAPDTIVVGLGEVCSAAAQTEQATIQYGGE
jgi:LacI family transcriptional regulator